ncbi:MAG: COX15/CtaA family protein [Firmicutes bacterium]|nr:COX15/CtaA family protein [Bacillota bacterium]
MRSATVVTRIPSKWLLALGVVASFGMFLINFIGFLDTQTGSAEGCGPDWPLCNGQVIPAMDNTHVIIEFLHRFLVGFFALVAVAFAIWAWTRFGRWLEVKLFAAVAIGFVIIQSLLGALAVVFVNPPEVLALHLGFGLLGMVGVVLLTVFLFQYRARCLSRQNGLDDRERGVGRKLVLWIRWIWVYVFIAIYVGSYISFRGAATACTGWPLCNGQVFPGFAGNVGLAFLHRLIALGLAVLVIFLLYFLRTTRTTRGDLFRGAIWLLVLTVLQIASGAWLILSLIDLNADLLHVSLLMILFTILSYLVLQSFPFRDRTRSELQ